MARQYRCVVGAVPERGQRDPDDIETVEEILAERPILDQGRQVRAGCGDDPGVELDWPRLSDTLDLPLLQSAKQL